MICSKHVRNSIATPLRTFLLPGPRPLKRRKTTALMDGLKHLWCLIGHRSVNETRAFEWANLAAPVPAWLPATVFKACRMPSPQTHKPLGPKTPCCERGRLPVTVEISEAEADFRKSLDKNDAFLWRDQNGGQLLSVESSDLDICYTHLS